MALCLNKKWRANVLQAVDDYCNPFEIAFVNAYFEQIFFKATHTWARPITFCGSKGLRIDRVFECEAISGK